MHHLRRSIVFVVLALALASCGDNYTPAGKSAVGQTSVSGNLVARSQNYRVVSTVNSGELHATSGTSSVKSGVAAQGGGQ